MSQLFPLNKGAIWRTKKKDISLRKLTTFEAFTHSRSIPIPAIDDNLRSREPSHRNFAGDSGELTNPPVNVENGAEMPETGMGMFI